MVYLLAGSLLLYVILLLLLMRGWRMIYTKQRVHGPDVFISVIVACRDEEAVIADLLRDLHEQDYPTFEVLLIDDHSSDKTVTQAQYVMKGNPMFRIIANEGLGKKNAITTGVKYARGPIILTTDADCRVKPGWLKSICAMYHDPRVMMVCGAVVIQEHASFFSKLQALEFASLMGSGGALIGLRKPVMCNGANLAFRKEAFESVKGYEDNLHVASGDDEFLMRKINTAYPDSIRFVAGDQSVVRTHPLSSLNDFFRQRFRWAGKWKHNTSFTAVALAVLIFLFQCTWITALVLVTGIGGHMLVFVTLIMLLVRLLVELFFLRAVCQRLNVPWHWNAFFVLQAVYPFYVVFTGLFSNFTTYTWKGRKI